MSTQDLSDWYSFGPGRAEQAQSGTGQPISRAERAKAEQRSDRNAKRMERKFRKR